MPLEPYQYQPAGSKASTPSPKVPQGGHDRRNSNASLWSSPESVDTRATTPNISPAKGNGPRILPRISTSDAGTNARPSYRRAQSQECDASLSIPQSRPGYQRSITCPPETEAVPTPTSTTSTLDSWHLSAAQSPVAFSSSYGRNTVGHARSTSTSALDTSTFRRHAFPYRSLPVYMTSQSQQYTPVVTPQLPDFVANPMLAMPHPLQRELTPELIYETAEEPTSTLFNYLTEANPIVDLVPESQRGVGDATAKHCWWDVRHLRTWDDFNLETIMSLPDFPSLLNVNIKATALPTPELPSTAYRPDTIDALHDTYNRHYATKVNAALKISQGLDAHAYMLQKRTARDGPHFWCSYVNSTEILGSNRGRIVGLVKPYERWNSDMRKGNPQKRVEYLAGLSQLQWMMREQECRYGFIMTEIELVCVRMGTEEGTPYFGLLELSRPIEIKTDTGLTACLALWYLHMLTSDQPRPGQCGWKVEVGAPAAWTRSFVLEEERDEWIAKLRGPQLTEQRRANRLRGFVMPKDAYNPRREGGAPRRRGG
ncbi:MAG: hypothetical protein Q9164_003701 [Protoblastenia rupestris]